MGVLEPTGSLWHAEPCEKHQQAFNADHPGVVSIFTVTIDDHVDVHESDSLPSLLEKVADQLNSCNEQLAKLPPAITTEPTAFVVALLTEFTSELGQCIHGSPTTTELVQSTRRTYESFRYAIRSSAPPFVPYKDANHAPKDISEYVRADSQDRKARNKKFTGKVMYLDDVRKHIHAYVVPVRFYALSKC